MRIETIELDGVLPEVFADKDGKCDGAQSDVWLRCLTLNRGTKYMVEAESGTGKSSLCSFMYGNRSDYRGEIKFDGRNIRKFGIREWCDARMTALALLPQEMRLFPELTVMDNIRVKNRLTGYKSEKEICDMLDRLEIGDKSMEMAGRLSIGQQQRVGIVRALCQPMDFLLLDEPVSHLDGRANRMVAELISEAVTAQGAGVVATSVGNGLDMEFDIILRL